MVRRLHAWWRLPVHEKFIALGLLLALPALHASLRIAGYVRTKQCIDRLTGGRSKREPNGAELKRAERLAQLAMLAGRRGLIEVACLGQSLLVYGLLRARGLSPDLAIGTRRKGEALDAHAWVELAGIALAQRNLAHQRFTHQQHDKSAPNHH